MPIFVGFNWSLPLFHLGFPPLAIRPENYQINKKETSNSQNKKQTSKQKNSPNNKGGSILVSFTVFGYIRQISVIFAVVQSIANNKKVGDSKQ